MVLNLGWGYDLISWLFDRLLFRGKLAELRRTTADLAQLQSGESVLDVGCGTGTLALMAKERVGTGDVHGVDPGRRQIARAQAKAARLGLAVDFKVGVIERLDFPSRSFDAVLSTLMMHHLPDDLKRQGLAEIARVLKPGGRLVVADVKRHEGRGRRLHRHGAGEQGIQDLPALMKDVGFSRIETGDIPLPRVPMVPGAGFAVGRI